MSSDDVPTVEISGQGFQASMELSDSTEFDMAAEILDMLKQRRHSEQLDVAVDSDNVLEYVADRMEDFEEQRRQLRNELEELHKRVNSREYGRESCCGQTLADASDGSASVEPVEADSDGADEVSDGSDGCEDAPDADSEESDEDEEDDADSNGKKSGFVDCPQCGDEVAEKGVSTHSAMSGDHLKISRFFENTEGLLECPVCSVEPMETGQELSNHLDDEHGCSMTEYYLENFDELQAVDVDEDIDEEDDTAENSVEETDSGLDWESIDTGPTSDWEKKETVIAVEGAERYVCSCGEEFTLYEAAESHEIETSHNNWKVKTS